MTQEFNYQQAKDRADVLRRQAERAHDQEQDLAKLLNEVTTRDGQAAIRILLAINGGAAIAILAFTSGLAARSSVPLSQIAEVVSSVKWFANGVISSALAAIFTYFTDFFYGGGALKRLRIWEYPYIHKTQKAKI